MAQFPQRTHFCGSICHTVPLELLRPATTPRPEPSDRNVVTAGLNSSVAKVRRAAEKVIVASKNHEAALAELRRLLREKAPISRPGCGTWAGYQRHRYNSEQACPPCLAACRDRARKTAASPHLSIREWALANGVPCSAKGRIPREVIDAYEQTHQGDIA